MMVCRGICLEKMSIHTHVYIVMPRSIWVVPQYFFYKIVKEIFSNMIENVGTELECRFDVSECSYYG